MNNISETIINTINTIFSTLFSSIDNNIYNLLDELTFINTDIIQNSYFEKLFSSNTYSSLIIIANSLLIGFALYYCIKLILSHFYYVDIERPYSFIFKLIIFSICVNSSYFICEQIIYINDLISSSICEIGKNIFNTDICFNSLIIKLNHIISIEEKTFNIFSIDGLIKSFITIGLFNLVFSYSLRYIMVKVFILISPFAILSLVTKSSSWFFKTWLKNFIGLLLLQSFISLILLVIFSIQFNSNNLLSKFMYIGGIYSLYKANSYIRELIGSISTDISTNFSVAKNLFK